MSSTPRQPRKKRRINPEENLEQIPHEVLPLVSPNQVKKSSKDPNRGMYPKKKGTPRGKQVPSFPSFSSASQLMKGASTSKVKNDFSLEEEEISPEKPRKVSKKLSKEKVQEKSYDGMSVEEEDFSPRKPRKVNKRQSKGKTPSKSSVKIPQPKKVPDLDIEIVNEISSKEIVNEVSSKEIVNEVSSKVVTKKDSKEKTPRQSFSSRAKKTISKTKAPIVNFANSIRKYFTSSKDNDKKTDPEVNYDSGGSEDFQKPSTSKATANSWAEAGTSAKSDLNKNAKSLITESNDLIKKRNESFFKGSGKYYGLVEDEKDEVGKPNYFERLPCHALEIILCQVPFIDLMKCKLVCKEWNEVISDDSFLYYKKTYYSLKFRKSSGSRSIEQMCKAFKTCEPESCFSHILKYMFKYPAQPSSDMYDLLSQNQRAVEAELVLNERFPEVLIKESKAWCIFAAALLLSETVEDVYSIYKSVCQSKSNCSIHDITNVMYCVATFLLYYQNKQGLNHGLHYRIYNALYWIENSLPSKDIDCSQSVRAVKGLPGQQSIHSYCDSKSSNLTYEQIRILNHRFQPNQVIKIVALAGTGKTTTLVHLAQLYPQVQFLNIMFNKAVCEEAKRRFPPNVTCKTAHSLAWGVYGRQFRYKLSYSIKPIDIVQHLQHNAGTRLQIHSYSKQVIITIEHFSCSESPALELGHVPTVHSDSDKPIHSEDRAKILKDAQQLWLKMTDSNDPNLKITHDVYLKLYQLSMPQFTDYQCIMVDEAQDCNPAMLAFVMSQDLPVIIVGDPNQQIYGFRGAKNAIQSIEATHIYHLTKSFRFGPEIAYVASCCLETLKSNTTQTLVGIRKPSCVNGKTEGQYAIIARSNCQLFNEAIRLCCLKRFRAHEPTSIQGAFAGGIRGYGFDQLLDVYLLHIDKADSVTDRFIKRFTSYKTLYQYAKNTDDNELLSKIELVNQHSLHIPEYIKIITEKCSHPMELANIIFTTAHKSKGLEFDTVCLTDDYALIQGSEYGRTRRINETEESNIMYVALTRAKRSLLMPDKLMRVLLLAQEKFEYPKLTSKILNDNVELECVQCTTSFAPHTVMVLERQKMLLASGRVINGGPLCVKCATEPTIRPRLTVEPVIMYLDPTVDYAHRSMTAFVGPLPNDPPIVRDDEILNDLGIVFVINVDR